MKNPPVRRSSAARPEIIDQPAPAIEEPKFSVIDYVVPLLVLCALGSVAFAAWSYMSSRNTAYKTAATGDLVFATREEDPVAYEVIGEEFQDTGAGQWATAAKADLYLSQGLDALYVDREEAESLLETSATAYRQVAERTKSDLLKARVTFGLAQAEEAIGNLDEAITQYRKIAGYPGASESLVNEANSRADALEKDDVRDFYKWFIAQQPATIDESTTPPASLDQTPASPNIDFPETNKKPDADVKEAADSEPAIKIEPASSEPATSEPASPDPKAAEGKTDSSETSAK